MHDTLLLDLAALLAAPPSVEQAAKLNAAVKEAREALTALTHARNVMLAELRADGVRRADLEDALGENTVPSKISQWAKRGTLEVVAR